MDRIAASFTRNLYIIPGGYFLVQFIKNLFQNNYQNPTWRTFSFRGISMKVDISKSMGAAIYWRGAHDWAPIFVLEKILRNGHTIVDVGANQGEYSLWAIKHAGNTGKVIAFEPMDGLYDQLTFNFSLNPKYQKAFYPVKIGLSYAAGKLNLYGKEGDNEGVNTMFPTETHTVMIQEIILDTLDNQLSLLNCNQVDLIKIDVEGAELQVLKGALDTLRKHKPYLMIEINREACLAGGYEPEEIFELLRPMGYTFEKIGFRGKRIPVARVPQEFCNILASAK
ncbi:FkbM family methyltransferase [Aquiflexum lacus]|uniref:FkbM family methyltransferase n=1 Tax=Aquiflexum lacus TaxID=2483805 RepID=UPI001895CDF5|nr:FkbM family methyltransferase [Aquiflexum lacus]